MDTPTSSCGAEAERAELGRRLGHDVFRLSRLSAGADWPASLREGYRHAEASPAGARPTRPNPDRYVRKWLQLRLNAYRRGRLVDERVTPDLLRRIDLTHCPVSRAPLTHGERLDSDWSVDRLNNDGAYAANNLAVMSTGANRAKGARSFEQVFALSQQQHSVDGLTPAQWLRLAALMLGPCFATRPQQAPVIPLAAPLPNLSLRTAMQLVQHLFTRDARQQAGKNALVRDFKRAAPGDERALTRLRMFADALHAGLKVVDDAHDVWLRPGVMAALLGWRECLGDEAWAIAGEISRQRASSSRVPASRLQSWHLPGQGWRC